MGLKRPFVVSAGSAEIKKNFFISIDRRNFGEAAGSVYYGPSESEIITDLEKGIDFLSPLNQPDYSTLYGLKTLDVNSISKAALTAAVLHKLSSIRNRYPWDILDLDGPSDIETSVTVCIDEPTKVLAEIKESKYPIIKLKLGCDGDEQVISGLRNISGKLFRADANGGWDLEKAERMIYELDRIDAELIEQPTPVEYIKEWRYLRKKCKILVLIDEGLNTIEDYYRYCDYVDGINVKISKSGGVLPAKDICLQAKKDKRRIMLGSMVETSIGVSQAVYLSSLAEFFDLDGPVLLKEDISSDIEYNCENVIIGDNIMGGPKIDEKFLNL